MAAAITLLQAASDVSDLSTYTFSSQNLGAESTDRYIVVCVGARAAGESALSLNSVTVSGVTANIVANAQNVATNLCISAIAIAAVPTGNTGDILLTFSRSMIRCGIVVFLVSGIDGAAAFDSKTSTAINPTAKVNIPANGISVAIATIANATSASWSGMTERTDSLIEAVLVVTTASDSFATQQTGLAVTCTPTSTITNPVACFASWSPLLSSRKRNHAFIGVAF